MRPGEKLYEELLIGDNVEATEHPLIMRVHEEYMAEAELNKALLGMKDHINNDPAAARNTLTTIVKNYTPPVGLVDHLCSAHA